MPDSYSTPETNHPNHQSSFSYDHWSNATSQVIDLTQSCSRNLMIALDQNKHPILNDEKWLQALTGFIRSQASAQLQLLVPNAAELYAFNPQLAQFLHRVTSKTYVRQLEQDQSWPQHFILIADQKSCIWQIELGSRIFVEKDSKAKNMRFQDQFNQLWLQSEESIETRSLYL